MIATEYINAGFPIAQALAALGLPKSVYYYKPSNGTKGKRRSTHTCTLGGAVVANAIVVEDIERELNREFVDYGYMKMTYCLRDNYGYIINPKKTYWLMKDHRLFNIPLPRNRSGKTWVKDLKPSPGSAFSFWEFESSTCM